MGRSQGTLTGVRVQRQKNKITVVLGGHGLLRYQVVPVMAYRLVLDFPDGSSSLSFRALSVKHHLLKEIRIEQFPKKLRLEFDVAQHVRYAVKSSVNALAIQFKHS